MPAAPPPPGKDPYGRTIFAYSQGIRLNSLGVWMFLDTSSVWWFVEGEWKKVDETASGKSFDLPAPPSSEQGHSLMPGEGVPAVQSGDKSWYLLGGRWISGDAVVDAVVSGSKQDVASKAATAAAAGQLITFPDLTGTPNEALSLLRHAWRGQFDLLRANQRALRGVAGFSVFFPVDVAYAPWSLGGVAPAELSSQAPRVSWALGRLEAESPSPVALAQSCEAGFREALQQDATLIKAAVVAHREALPGELKAWRPGCALDWLLQELAARLDFVLSICGSYGSGKSVGTMGKPPTASFGSWMNPGTFVPPGGVVIGGSATTNDCGCT